MSDGLDDLRDALGGMFNSSPLVASARMIGKVGDYASDKYDQAKNWWAGPRKKVAGDIELPKESPYGPRRRKKR